MSEDLQDTLKVGEVTLTMYAGLIEKMENALGGFDGLDSIATDSSLQSKFVTALVTKYDDNGNPDGYYINPFKLSPSDFQNILDWGMNHYTVFMSNSSARIVERLKNLQKKLVEAQKDL